MGTLRPPIRVYKDILIDEIKKIDDEVLSLISEEGKPSNLTINENEINDLIIKGYTRESYLLYLKKEIMSHYVYCVLHGFITINEYRRFYYPNMFTDESAILHYINTKLPNLGKFQIYVYFLTIIPEDKKTNVIEQHFVRYNYLTDLFEFDINGTAISKKF